MSRRDSVTVGDVLILWGGGLILAAVIVVYLFFAFGFDKVGGGGAG